MSKLTWWLACSFLHHPCHLSVSTYCTPTRSQAPGWELEHSIATIYRTRAVFLPAQHLIGRHWDFPFANHPSFTCCSSGSTLANPPPHPSPTPPTPFRIFISLTTEIVSRMGSWSKLASWESALRLLLELLRKKVLLFHWGWSASQMEPWTCWGDVFTTSLGDRAPRIKIT